LIVTTAERFEKEEEMSFAKTNSLKSLQSFPFDVHEYWNNTTRDRKNLALEKKSLTTNGKRGEMNVGNKSGLIRCRFQRGNHQRGQLGLSGYH